MKSHSFRTIELSDPRFESEGLRHITVKSKALKMRGDMTLWIPPGVSDPMPLVILLHGVYASHWAWSKKGGAHRTAQELIRLGKMPPMVLAMPSDGLWGDGSGYVPHARRDFESWIVEEVPTAAAIAIEPGLLAAHFFLGGLSMGGFGALRLGAKYGTYCAGVSAHSSITEFHQMRNFVEEDLCRYNTDEKNQSVLATILENRKALPPLRFDCGLADPLLEANRALHGRLEKQGIAHTYEEFVGGHDWSYWEKHLASSLQFFARHIS